jgi:hypothetical protein
MAYQIAGTTEADKALLNEMRDLAWRERLHVSEVIRRAFRRELEAEGKK